MRSSSLKKLLNNFRMQLLL